ncbi:MAG TPA: hypothetical protein IAA76_07780 [Candidatus Ornithospirochaeta stercorigallinarum]|nr:hypothetical protein [Candidatus Ornithospirochaeta stercorigallinarum]
MLNYRRLIAFLSRVHTYITVLYAVFFLLFFLFLHLDVSTSFYNLLVSFSSAIGWTIVLEGMFLLIASVHISFLSRVIAFEPFLLTLLRLMFYFILSFILDFFVSLNGTGIVVGVDI